MPDNPYATSNAVPAEPAVPQRSTVTWLQLIQATALTMMLVGTAIMLLFRYTPYFVFHTVWFEWVSQSLSDGDFSAEPKWSYAIVYAIGMATPHVLLTLMIFAPVLRWTSRGPAGRQSS